MRTTNFDAFELKVIGFHDPASYRPIFNLDSNLWPIAIVLPRQGRFESTRIKSVIKVSFKREVLQKITVKLKIT